MLLRLRLRGEHVRRNMRVRYGLCQRVLLATRQRRTRLQSVRQPRRGVQQCSAMPLRRRLPDDGEHVRRNMRVQF